jgi:hypothetical protein
MVTRNSEYFHLAWVNQRAESAHRRERDWVLGEFKSGRSPILIATDVASRGLGVYSLLRQALRQSVVVLGCATHWIPHVCVYVYGRGVAPVDVIAMGASFYSRF